MTDPAVQARLEKMLADVAALPHVGEVASPFAPDGAGQISKNGRIGYATVTFDEQANLLSIPAIKRVINRAEAADGDGLQVELGGQAIEKANQPERGRHGVRLPGRGDRPVRRLRVAAGDGPAADSPPGLRSAPASRSSACSRTW